MMKTQLILIQSALILLLTSCQFKVSSKGSNLGSVISGVATPFVGSIVEHNPSTFFSSSYAAVCADPVYARLYELNADGSISEGNWSASQILGANARYKFNLKELGLSTSEVNVNYLVKVEGCNGEVYKRPITDFDDKQDIDYKTTVVADVVNVDNASIAKGLNEVPRSQVKQLIDAIAGSSRTTALDSLTNDTTPQNLFTTIFGAPPEIILDSKPEVMLSSPLTNLNELQVSSFSVQTFHPDPNYSFAYRWKLDGVVKSSAATWNYIPGANHQGQHQVEVFVGKNDGSNNIDTTKPYYHKTFYITVDNNIMPSAPAISINAATPAPRAVNTIDIDINTGAALSNCDAFSEMAISETNTVPGPMTFTLTCIDVGIQTESVSFINTDGNKTLYLWTRDAAGNVSLPSTVSFVYDSTAPSVALTSTPAIGRGAETVPLGYSVSDMTSSVSANLYYAADGSTFSLIKALNTSVTSTSFTLPSNNTSVAKLRIIATDAAGNATTVTSSAFTVDSTNPGAPSIALSSGLYSQEQNVTLTAGSCSDEVHSVLVNEGSRPSLSDTGWQICSTGSDAITYTIPNTTEGLHNLKVWSKDLAGNVSSLYTNVPVYLDLTAPSLAFTSLPDNVKGGSTQNIIVSLTELHTQASQEVTFEFFDGSVWNTVGTQTVSNGPLSSVPVSKSFLVPSVNTNQAKVRAVFQDLANRLTLITSGNFIVDSAGPVGSSISINGGVPLTGNKNVLLSFSVSDNYNKITSFCPQYNITATPLDNDPCWITLESISETPAQNVTITNFPYQIGSIESDYDVRIWYKDEVGNISSNTDTSGVDTYTIAYKPDPAPTISNLIASSTDTPSSPLTTGDTTVPLSFDLYIRWSVTDNLPIPNGNITLSYTTNDTNYITIQDDVNNGINGDCTLTPGTTGCFKWAASSPFSTYYRIKMEVKDSSGTIIFDVSNPINTGSVKFLSGNTSLGIGGAATNAILLGNNESGYIDAHDGQSLVVTKTGYIFLRYQGRGLTYISPQDGILKDLLPVTNTTFSGDGGSVFNATLRTVNRMVLDYNDNILVWDYDRVRKIDLTTSPWSITTVFGGGADSSDGAPAASASLPANYAENLTVTPDGRIWFNRNAQIWYFDPSDQKVKRHITLTGTGTDNMSGWRATYDATNCPGTNNTFSFNKSTSAITKIIRRMSATTSASCGSASSTQPYYNSNFNVSTGVAEAPHPGQTTWSSFKFTGMDGNIYVLMQGRTSLTKYNPVTNAWQTVLGTGSNGRCADGTPATSCKVVVMSAFVSEFGKIYFMDLGVLRMIDSSGNVQTIAGQPRNFGVGFNPVSARYSQINFFDINGNDIYVKNELENQIIKFSLAGGNLELVAGNTARGTPTIGADAVSTQLSNCGWSMPCGFVIDSANNRLYHYGNVNGAVSYIDLVTGKWVQQATGLQDGGTRISYIGKNSDGLFTYLPSSHGVTGTKNTFRIFNQTNNTSTHIFGLDSVESSITTTICTGVDGTTCGLSHTQAQDVQVATKFDPSTGNWLITRKGSNKLYTIPSMGGIVNLFETMNNTFNAYDHYKNGGNEYVFYCGTNGNLYKRNIATDTETTLTLPISTMKCDSHSLFYNASRNSLIFAYKQNGLFGIAEYLNP